jgi:DNA-binding MarR family transcriptional regulator
MARTGKMGTPDAPHAASSALSSPLAFDGDGVSAAPLANLADVDPSMELDELEHRAWRAFLVVHARVARRLEMDLLTRSDLPLAEFDVLFQLHLAEGHRLRMNELADRVVLSRAGITRLVDRLVADGLVARIKCVDDARGAYAVLTENGRARLDEARPGHFAAVRRCFTGAFARPELETLAGLLDRRFPVD